MTAIDLVIRWALPAREPNLPNMNVVVQYDGELYSLLVNWVGEVMSFPETAYEKYEYASLPLERSNERYLSS